MIRALLLLLALGAGSAEAQIQTDAAGLRELGLRLFLGGEPERAAELAQALIARDPRDLDALLLLGRASLEAGDWETALQAGRAAHGLAEGRGRFLAARISARAHAEMGQWTRAQVWLRRARGDAPDEEALRDLSREFTAVRALNPFAVTLSFGVAPSSNINGGTSADVIPIIWALAPDGDAPVGWVKTNDGEYMYLAGTPNADARPLSGWRIASSATLAWRVAGDARRGTYVEGQFLGRTYVLSEESRESLPEAVGSDYSDIQASVSLVHRWRGEGASGPSAVRLTFGRSWYALEPYTRFAQLSWDRGITVGPHDRLDFSAFADWTEREQRDSYASLGGRARWTHVLASGDRTTLTFSVREHLDVRPDTTFSGATAGAGYDWAEPILSLRLGVGAEVEWRQYDESWLAPPGREDWRAALRTTVGLPEFEMWGFEPTFSVEASRTESTAYRIDKQSLTLDLAFRSTF